MAKQDTKIFLHTSHEDHQGVHNWHIPQYGCSGMGATMVGLLMGYHQIVLAGIHLDDSGHFYDPHWVITSFARQYREFNGAPRVWKGMNEKFFEGKVKALSGRLRDYLGAP